jgi:hypothetical protein
MNEVNESERNGLGPSDLNVQESAPPHSPRYYPLEADEAGKERISTDPLINREHLGTLQELMLLRASDEEKTRVYRGTLDKEARSIVDDLLDTAINELGVEDATVVGIINAMITRMLDIRVAFRKGRVDKVTVYTLPPEKELRAAVARLDFGIGRFRQRRS